MTLTERISKPLQTQTAQDSLVGITGQGISAITSAVFFALSARAVTVEEFGLFMLMLASATIIRDIIDPSLNASLIHFVGQGRSMAEQITRQVIQVKLLYFAFILGVGILLSQPLSQLVFNQSLPLLLILTVVNSAVSSLSAMISGFLQAHRRFRLDSLFVVTMPILRLMLFWGLSTRTQISLMALVGISIVASGVASILFVTVITPQFRRGQVESHVQKAALKFALPLTLSTLAGTLTDRLSLFIVNYFLGPAAVGLLGAVWRLFVPAQQVAGVLSSVLGSRFSHFTSLKDTRAYLLKAWMMILPISLACMSVAVIAPWLLAIMYGADYVTATPILRILCLGFGIFLLQVPLSSLVTFGWGKTQMVALVSLLQLLLNVVLQWWFIGRWGIIGSAVVSAMVMVITALLYLAYVLPRLGTQKGEG